MITFYPGPSKIYPQIEQYLQDAFRSGILQMNHRSREFMDLLRDTIEVFKKKQEIPENYQVYFTSSATECWEIVAQSLISKGSFHVFNGAFGKKWFEYTARCSRFETRGFSFGINETFDSRSITDFEKYDTICFTQNETSNGSQIKNYSLNYQSTQPLIISDITSSLGGIKIDWQKGDVWLASVQKCLGLPAGMGILIVSPNALKRAEKVNDRKFYNSLLFIQENFEKYQTHYTPNILSIFLLKKVMEQVLDIEVISKKTKHRAQDFYEFLETKTQWKLLIENLKVRSETVIAIEGKKEEISQTKQKAKEKKIILGNGYGEWKDTTFRIANFPAIEDFEFETLKKLLAHEF